MFLRSARRRYTDRIICDSKCSRTHTISDYKRKRAVGPDKKVYKTMDWESGRVAGTWSCFQDSVPDVEGTWGDQTGGEVWETEGVVALGKRL